MADRITYVGLDVHKDTIVVAAAGGGLRSEVREYGRIANTSAAPDRLLRKLGGAGVTLRFCYEAGPCGYGIQRRLSGRGHECVVVAAVGKVEPEHEVERLAIERADRKHVRDKLQDEAVLLDGCVDRFGIHTSAADAPRFETEPALVPLFFVFFEHKIAILPRVEVSHRGMRFLHPLKEFENRFTTVWKFHLRVQVQVDIEVVSKGTIRGHGFCFQQKTNAGVGNDVRLGRTSTSPA